MRNDRKLDSNLNSYLYPHLTHSWCRVAAACATAPSLKQSSVEDIAICFGEFWSQMLLPGRKKYLVKQKTSIYCLDLRYFILLRWCILIRYYNLLLRFYYWFWAKKIAIFKQIVLDIEKIILTVSRQMFLKSFTDFKINCLRYYNLLLRFYYWFWAS